MLIYPSALCQQEYSSSSTKTRTMNTFGLYLLEREMKGKKKEKESCVTAETHSRASESSRISSWCTTRRIVFFFCLFIMRANVTLVTLLLRGGRGRRQSSQCLRRPTLYGNGFHSEPFIVYRYRVGDYVKSWDLLERLIDEFLGDI